MNEKPTGTSKGQIPMSKTSTCSDGNCEIICIKSWSVCGFIDSMHVGETGLSRSRFISGGACVV